MFLSGLRKSNRSWWQHACRAVAATGLVLLAAYVTLPWWLPTGMLRRSLASRLSEQLGSAVRIEQLSVSWADGVRIENLSVDMPAPFGPGQMLTVERITADFSPLTLLLRDRIAWMHLKGLRADVRADRDGRLNIADLAKLDSRTQTGRLSVSDAEAVLTLPDSPQPTRLRISDMRYQARPDREPGRLTVVGAVVLAERPAPVTIQLSRRAARPGIVATAVVSFCDLDLAQLHLPEQFNLPLSRLHGICGGLVRLQLDRKLIVDEFSVDLDIRGLDAQPLAGPTLPVIERAGLKTEAAIDLLNNRIELRSLAVRLPGVDLAGRGSVLAQRGMDYAEAIESLELAGVVQPSMLAAVITGSGELVGDVTVAGLVKLSIEAGRAGPQFNVRLAADAVEASVSRAGRVIKPAGTPLSLRVQTGLDRRRWELAIETAELAVGSNRLSLRGAVRSVDRLFSRYFGGAQPFGLADVLGDLADVDLYATYEIGELDSLRTLVPEMAGFWRQTHLAGRIDGKISLDNAGQTRLHATAHVPAEAASRAGPFVKPTGSTVAAELTGAVEAEAVSLRDVYLNLAVGSESLCVDQAVVDFLEDDSGVRIQSSGRLDLTDVPTALACLPGLDLGPLELSGRLAGRYDIVLGPSARRGLVQLDLADTEAAVDGVGIKPLGQRGSMQLAFERVGHAADGMADRLALQIDTPAYGLEVQAWAQNALAWPWQAGRFEGSVLLREALAELPSALGKVASRIGLGGQLRVRGALATSDDDLALRGRVVANDLTVKRLELGEYLSGSTAPDDWAGLATLSKPIGLAASADFDLEIRADASQVELKQLAGSVGDLRFAATGRARRAAGAEGALARLKLIEGKLALSTDRADRLVGLMPSLARHLPKGGAGLQVHYAGGQAEAELSFDELGAVSRGRKVMLDGEVSLAIALGPDEGDLVLTGLACEKLRIEVGPSVGWLVADIAGLPDAPMGRAYLLFENLDGWDLTEWLAGPTPTEGPAKLNEQQVAELENRADRMIGALRSHLVAADVAVELTADRCRTYDPSVGKEYVVQNLAAEASARSGQVRFGYVSSLNGGTYRNEIRFDLVEPNPEVTASTSMSDLVATESLQPQLAKFFPGNTVEEYFNRDEQVTVPLRRYLAGVLDWRYRPRPVGDATTVAIGGYVKGRGAPKFVTRVFPGLNLTKYRYQKMTSFAQFLADGTAVNDMIFSGSVYNLYMEGQTDPDNFGEYEIGLLLTSRSPQWQHRWKQGRIPILKFKGLIEGGKIHDEQTAYFWPNESLFIMFLRNNIFYRMWVNSKHRQPDGVDAANGSKATAIAG